MTTTSQAPSRGEVWLADLNSTRGHEQAGKRPCLIISVDLFNHGPAGLVIVAPLTTKVKNIPFHVLLSPPEGGVTAPSYIKCEDVRSIAKERLERRWGAISPQTMALVEDRLRILLSL